MKTDIQPTSDVLRIIFVSAASNAIGFGHLSRCITLAIYAQKCGFHARFLVFGNEAAKAQVIAAGFECCLLAEPDKKSIEWSQPVSLRADVVVVDLLYQGFFESHKSLVIFNHLRSVGRVLVAIDVIGKDSIACNLPNLDVDIVVSPYVASAAKREKTRWRYLFGAKYALLAPEYVNLPSRQQRIKANRVLVTCGGSDPKGYTAQVIQSLEDISQTLEIRAVVGPMFSAQLRANIGRLMANSCHQITMVSAPSTLINEMLWCDLAIGTNGLTKYEFAASATPALLFSIDEHHNKVNKPFAKMLTSFDLGMGVSARELANETVRHLKDRALRCKMAKNGRKLVDGMGTDRLFGKITEKLSC